MRTNHPPQFFSSHLRRARSVVAGLGLVFLTTATVDAEVRTWENLEGRKIRAEFVRVEGDTVHIKLESGRMSKVEIRKLSQADQDFVKALTSPQEEKTPLPPAPSVPLAVPSAPAPTRPLDSFPNDDGPAIPAHLKQKWSYPPGVARKVAAKDGYRTPDGKPIWTESTFAGNGLTFFGKHARAVMSMDLSKSRPGLVDFEGRFILGGDSSIPLPEGTIDLGDPGDNALVAFSRKVEGVVLWGYVNLEGKVVIDPKWHAAGRFSQGLAPVSVIATQYGSMGNNHVVKYGKYQYINAEGDVAIPGDWPIALPFPDEGPALVQLPAKGGNGGRSGAWIHMKADGSPVVLPGGLLTWPYQYRGGRLVTNKAIYDPQGKVLLEAPPNYGLLDADDGSGVCILVGLTDWPKRLVDRKSGRCYGPPLQYRTVASFSEGLACMTSDGKQWGFIDQTGAVAIEPKFPNSDSFTNGYIMFHNRQADKVDFWNREGRLFTEN